MPASTTPRPPTSTTRISLVARPRCRLPITMAARTAAYAPIIAMATTTLTTLAISIASTIASASSRTRISPCGTAPMPPPASISIHTRARYLCPAQKSVFKRVVVNPDVFEYDAFVRSMRSVFGSDIVIEFLIV